MENASQGTGAPSAGSTPEQTPAQGAPNPGAIPQGGDQTAGSAVKEAAAEAVRRHKLKVDGQEIEVDEDELKRGYTHQKAANKKLQEGLKAKKQAEEFIKMMKDKGSLFETIKKLGHDPRALAEEYLAAQLEDEMLDPREKELREYKKKLSTYEELEKKQREAAEKKRDDALKAKFSEEYSQQFVQALQETKLPPTKAMVGKMAEYIYKAAQMKFQMTPQEAAKLVREDIEDAHRNLYGEADAETLVKLIGEQGLAKVRTFDTSRLKDPNAQLKTPTEQGEPNTRVRDSGKRMSPSQWREFNRK